MAADRAELESLIRAADKAGDSAAVRVLFSELDKLEQSQEPVAPPQEFAGAGGYNPMMSRLGGLGQSMGQSLGMTPENISSPLNALGPAEAALQLGSGGLGTVAGGLAGIGQGLWNSVVPESMEGPQAGDRVRQVQEAMTYQPRSAVGKAISGAVAYPFEKLAQAGDAAGDTFNQQPYAVKMVQDENGGFREERTPVKEKEGFANAKSAVAAGVNTAIQSAPAIFSRRASPQATSKAKGSYTPKPEAPTTAELGAAAAEAYKRADESGIAMKAESFQKMKDGLLMELKDEGIDPTLHPKATAAMKRLAEKEGPITLQEAETLRRVASDAMDTLEKADARQAGKIVDAIDDYIDNLSDADLVSGNVKDAAALSEARSLYSRKRKAEEIERLMARAELSPSGYENGLRIEFRSLAKNDRKFRRYTKEEQAAIRRVAEGGKTENALRLIGKLAPTGIVSGGLSSGAGLVALGPVGAVGVPAVGMAGRMGAKALTKRNAERAAMIMRRGPNPIGAPLTKGQPTPKTGGPQGASAAPAAPVAKPRSAAQVQADIRRLAERARLELAREDAGSPKVAAFQAELARLQSELQATLIGQ